MENQKKILILIENQKKNMILINFFRVHQEYKALKLSDLRIIATLGVGGFGKNFSLNTFFREIKMIFCFVNFSENRSS